MSHICHINLAKGFHGGERQTLNLMKELKLAGIQQSLVCHPKGQLKQEVDALGITTRAVSHWLTGHLQRSMGDIMHCHCGRGVHWAALQHKLYHQPYLITRRVDNPIKQNAWTQSAYKNAAFLVCVSRAVETEVHKISAKIKTQVIPDSFSGFEVDTKRVAEIKAQYPGKFLVGQAGKLLEHKGFRYTLAAAKQLETRLPNAHLLILGDGPLKTELQALSQDLTNVSLLGHQTEIGNYLAALDLFVFPSVTEGLGSSILEAMQLQVPVLATQAGGIPDIINDGVNGRLVPPADSNALTTAICQLHDEPEQRTAYVLAASQGLARYSPPAIANDYIELYKKLNQQQLGNRVT